MSSERLRKSLGRIKRILKTGWRIFSEADTANSLSGLFGTPLVTSAITLWGYLAGLPGPLIAAMFLVMISAIPVGVAGFLGWQEDRKPDKDRQPYPVARSERQILDNIEIPTGGEHGIEHHLQIIPSHVTQYLVCKKDDFGYSPGDVLANVVNYPMQLTENAVFIRFPSGTLPLIPYKYQSDMSGPLKRSHWFLRVELKS